MFIAEGAENAEKERERGAKYLKFVDGIKRTVYNFPD